MAIAVLGTAFLLNVLKQDKTATSLAAVNPASSAGLNCLSYPEENGIRQIPFTRHGLPEAGSGKATPVAAVEGFLEIYTKAPRSEFTAPDFTDGVVARFEIPHMANIVVRNNREVGGWYISEWTMCHDAYVWR